MKAILNHLRTDPNAKYHVMLGIGASVSALVMSIVLTDQWYIYCGAPLVGSFVMGIYIEVWQRITRAIGKKPQNSTRESILDAAGTTFWPLWFVKKIKEI